MCGLGRLHILVASENQKLLLLLFFYLLSLSFSIFSSVSALTLTSAFNENRIQITYSRFLLGIVGIALFSQITHNSSKLNIWNSFLWLFHKETNKSSTIHIYFCEVFVFFSFGWIKYEYWLRRNKRVYQILLTWRTKYNFIRKFSKLNTTDYASLFYYAIVSSCLLQLNNSGLEIAVERGQVRFIYIAVKFNIKH